MQNIKKYFMTLALLLTAVGGAWAQEKTTWYVDASATGGDGKTPETAFKTLNKALEAAVDKDTVKIASGTYSGNANTGIYIQKYLTFEKYGDGEAIFDGEGKGTIWSVGVDSINIYGLTFINGVDYYGGAMYFLRDLSNSVINATFKDNSVNMYGGAIYVGNSVSNLTLQSTFINNHANEYGAAVYIKSTASNLILNSTFNGNTADKKGAGVYIGGNADNVKVYGEYRNNAASQGEGGVIYANKAFSSSVIDATFINNTAKNLGGAFCFNGDLTGVDISGKFLNNTGGDCIIYVANSVSGNSIHDAVFLNNEAYKIFYVNDGDITAKDNWFGNNASKYYEMPEDVGIDLENWLFLNATANPSELAADETSTIIFKLSSFNGSKISDYDASKMNVVLELSQTLGELNKNTTSIGEEVIYTAKQEGDASVTGKVGNVEYTIPITVNKISGPEVAWNKTSKTGTFEMPDGNVEIAPIYAPVAQWAKVENVDQLPTAIEGIYAESTDAIVKAGTVAKIGETENLQGTLMYAVGTSATEQPALSAFSATLPTAEKIAAGDVYVWYYIKGVDTPDGTEATAENTFNDSEICTTPLKVTVLNNKFNILFNAANANTIEAGKATVTVGGTAATVTEGKLEGVKMGSEVKLEAKPGYKFRKVEAKKHATK